MWPFGARVVRREAALDPDRSHARRSVSRAAISLVRATASPICAPAGEHPCKSQARSWR
jgi:hypothetical protein